MSQTESPRGYRNPVRWKRADLVQSGLPYASGPLEYLKHIGSFQNHVFVAQSDDVPGAWIIYRGWGDKIEHLPIIPKEGKLDRFAKVFGRSELVPVDPDLEAKINENYVIARNL